MNRVTLAIILLVFISPITSCKNSAVKEKVVLRILMWGPDTETKMMDSTIARFEKLHPNIEVNREVAPWQMYMEKLMTVVAGNKPPDVVRMSYAFYTNCAEGGLLIPIDEFVENDKSLNLNDFYKPVLNAWAKYKGKWFVLPQTCDMPVLFYNKDLFDKYHLAYPNKSWTLNDVMKASKVLTRDLDGNGKLDQWGIVPGEAWNYVLRNNGLVYSEDGTKCLLDQRASYEGIENVVALSYKYHLTPRATDTADISAMGLFYSGKIGMVETGNWMISELHKYVKDFEYDQTMLPSGKIRRQMIQGTGFGMVRGTKYPKEAWEFIKFLSSPYEMLQWSLLTFDAPVRKSVAESKKYRNQSGMPKHRVLITEAMKYSTGIATGPWSMETQDIVGNDLSMAFLGKEDVKTACERTTKRVNELIEFRLRGMDWHKQKDGK